MTPKQCAAGHTFSGKVVEEPLSDAAPRYQQSGNLAVTRESGNGINHDGKYYNARGSCYLHRVRNDTEWRFERREIWYSPMISIRQSVKSAHDRVPKRRGRDCPHWPRFETQMASGARCYIVYTSFAPLVHKSRTIFISVVTKVVHPIECI